VRFKTQFVKALVWRDLRRYFSNPTGYVFITLFIFLSAAAAFWQDRFFLNNLANLDQLNNLFPFLLLFFVPALTMSVWADERRQATDELLLTMPATSLEVVLGKFIATVAVFSVALALSLSHVAVLFWLGRPDLGVMLANYLGYWLIGASLISVGLVASLLTANAAIAFILGALLCTALVYIDSIFNVVSPALGTFLAPLGLVPHFRDFASGVVSVSGLIYFVSVAGLMLYLTTTIIDRRHWPRKVEGRSVWFHQSIRIASVVIAVVSLNVIVARAGLRVDVTAERLHSLSPQTRTLLRELSEERPVFVQGYLSPAVPEPYVQARANLLSTLREIDVVAGPRVEVIIHDTEPFSNEAREAREKFGIVARSVPTPGSARAGYSEVYMGLAITRGAEEEVIPFLDRGLSPEYELARSIRVVADAGRKKIGVLQTAINLFGGLDFQTMRTAPVWSVVTELRRQYEVVQVQLGIPPPPDLEGLLVVLPSSLSQTEMDVLLESIEGGLPTLLLVDPLPAVNINQSPREEPGADLNPLQRQQAPQKIKGNVEEFMSRIGVSWDAGRIIWDSYNPHPDLGHLPPEVVFVGRGNDNEQAFNPSVSITSQLQELVFLYPGELAPTLDTRYEFTPLVQTGRTSGHFDYHQMVQRTFFGVQVNRNLPHRPNELEYVVAAQVRGVPLIDPDEMLGTMNGETDGDHAADGGNPPNAPADPTRPLHVIVVADIDFISEQFFQIRARGPQTLNFDNVTFFLNCIDLLIGDESFVALRGKRVRHRTLRRVEEQTRIFIEQRIQEERQAEAEAEAALEEAQRRLEARVNEIQERTDLDARAKQIMARTVQEAESRRFEVLKANIEAEKDAKIHASRERMEEQIRRIQSNIKTFAVLLPPVPVFLLGILIFVKRQRREREGAAAERRLRV
jgi:ABC-2 type transport system permease protein